MNDQPFTRIRPEYETNGTLRYAPISDEFAVPVRFVADSETVSLRVEIDSDGHPRCRAVQVRGERLTSDDLRLPLARLLRQAVAGAAVPVTPGATGEVDPGAVLAGLLRRGGRERDFYTQFVNDTDRPRRGAPVTDEHLQRVAAVYRAALDRGDPPTQTVADAMHASRPTAARWVAKARERGMLGAALRARAGEAH
jgi:hypothetical protein